MRSNHWWYCVLFPPRLRIDQQSGAMLLKLCQLVLLGPFHQICSPQTDICIMQSLWHVSQINYNLERQQDPECTWKEAICINKFIPHHLKGWVRNEIFTLTWMSIHLLPPHNSQKHSKTKQREKDVLWTELYFNLGINNFLTFCWKIIL